jgi:hypothetical protein
MAGVVGENKVAKIIQGADVPGKIDGLMIASRPGQVAAIDHVILGSGRFVVVETKTWNGVIRGGSREKEWVQTRPNGEEVRHRNPLFQAQRQARILAKASGVPVTWVVVMAGRCSAEQDSFPDGVATLDTISDHLPHLMDDVLPVGQVDRETIMAAWTKLLAQSQKPGAANAIEKRAAAINDKVTPREWLGWIVMAVASSCVAFQMMIAQGLI